MDNNPYIPAWKDIELIWNKWTNVLIPPSIQNLCKQEFQDVFGSLQTFIERNIEYGNIKWEEIESYEKGQEIAYCVNQSAQASFMVGLEYGVKDTQSPRNREFILKQSEIALPYIKAAGGPVSRIGSLYISLFVSFNQISKDEAVKIASVFGDELLT